MDHDKNSGTVELGIKPMYYQKIEIKDNLKSLNQLLYELMYFLNIILVNMIEAKIYFIFLVWNFITLKKTEGPEFQFLNWKFSFQI